MSLAVPPLQTQKEIGSALAAYDDLIQNNTRRIEILEEMARAIYREWFVEFRFSGYEDVDLVESELGPIPEGWRWIEFGGIAALMKDGMNPEMADKSTVYIGLDHIPRRSAILTEWGVSDEVSSRKYVFQKRDILFGKLRPYFHKVVVAPQGGICSTDVMVIRSTSDWPCFTLMTAASDSFVQHASATSTGTDRPRADWSAMSSYAVPIPGDVDIILHFEALVEPMIELSKRLVAENGVLTEARDLLLPKLVSGEIDVSDLELDVGDAVGV